MSATRTNRHRPASAHGVPVRPASALIAALLMGGFAAASNARELRTASTPTDYGEGKAPAQLDGAAQESNAPTDGDVIFNPTFLKGRRDNAVDLSRFERGGQTMPGVYRADVYVNGNWVTSEDITLRARAGEQAQPCFTPAMLERYGANVASLSPDALKPLAAANACERLEALLPNATASFDAADLRLIITVPQADMRRTPRGYVDPKYWDRGVNAGFIDYNANLYSTDSYGTAQTQGFLGLNTGVNVAGWQLRSNSSLSWQDSGSGGSRMQWQNVATYVQRDLKRLRSRITLGESFTSGELFDSVGFRGAQIASDDRMLPESKRGYAPIVRGVAQTNAKVTVRQNGNIIYETTVAPGPFVLDDLYATGYGGNLDVTVQEADGRRNTFSVPYASVSQLLRPGVTRYALTVGQLRDSSLRGKAPYFAQGIMQRGITDQITLYGGLLGAQGYGATQAGIAINTKAGAISVDATAAQTSVPGASSMRGQSYRVGYSKLLEQTSTNLTVAAYRYSTSGYLSLQDAARLRSYARAGEDTSAVWQARSRFLVSANQPLGDRRGNLYVSASAQNYWNRPSSDVQFQIGYTNSWRSISYNLSVSRMRSGNDGRQYSQFYVGVTIPLGRVSRTIATVSTNLTHDTRGNTQAQTSFNGTAGDLNQLSYNLHLDANNSANTGTAVGGGANLQYRAPFTELRAGASTGSHFRQMSVGAMGSIVAHPGGITLGQSLGDTIAIVEARGAKGASLTNAPGVRVDRHGYAIVPYLTPYSLNTVEIDPKGSPADVEIKETSQKVAPHLGSVVMLHYQTVRGRTLLAHATLPDGKPLPFGADVIDPSGSSVGAVGQGGQIYARVPADSGTLTAKWGERSDQRCSFGYAVPASPLPDSLPLRLSVKCELPTIAAAALKSGAKTRR